ncbi:MAG: AMIN domain-containing protein [Arcobacteraceae bacterium]|nr:AMIN domain-containing protein [Arcobacteraceae bacterium]
MIKLLLITTLVTISLFARLNPFEPVLNKNDLNNTKSIKSEPIQISKPVKSIDDGLRTVKITSHDGENRSKQIVMTKVKIVEKIVEKKLTKKQLLEQCKTIEKDISKIVVKPKVKLKPKPKTKPKKFVAKTYKVLPFLTINSNKNNIVIKTRKKYKLIRYYIEQGERKFVFDFKGKVLTYTKYKNLNAPFFKSYVVGNHPEDNYFRVVITVKKTVNKYKVSMKNNIATITYK